MPLPRVKDIKGQSMAIFQSDKRYPVIISRRQSADSGIEDEDIRMF